MSKKTSEVDRIVDQLERAHRGDAWHGPSLLELLSNVDETRARARPIPGAHTIEELVMHIVAWQDEGVRRLDGEFRDLAPKEDFPEATGWTDVLDRLNASFQSLMQRVRELDDGALDADVPGQRHTVYGLLHGIVQHNLYHAGQVALLKKS